jgi:hypothetical protein
MRTSQPERPRNDRAREVTMRRQLEIKAKTGWFAAAVLVAVTVHFPAIAAGGTSGSIPAADEKESAAANAAQPAAASCVENATTACLIGGRYKVTSHWQNQYDNGKVSTLSVTRLTDATAAFWLSDANTYEYVIRINTATDNGKAWIAIPTFTDVEFWVDVTDTVGVLAQSKEYHSPPGNRDLLYDPFFFVYP